MPLFQTKNQLPLHGILREYYLQLEADHTSPFEASLNALIELEKSSKSPEELAYYLMEDVIYNSLICAYMEHIMLAIKETPELIGPIVERFYQDHEFNERELGEQTMAHANYVQNYGKCEGCNHCKNHADLEEIVYFWETGDLNFFKKLFLSMNTIQISFNYILQDYLIQNPSKSKLFEIEEILKFREFIVVYSDNKFDELFPE